MTPAEKFLAEVKARAEKAPAPPLFDWDEHSLRIAYLNGGLARATYEMQCRYVGPKHAEVGTRLIEDALRVAIRTDVDRLVAMVELARGRLQGLAESSLYDTEAKWAAGVLAELDRIAGEGK